MKRRIDGVKRGTTFNLEAAAFKTLGKDIADDVYKMQMEAVSPDVAFIRDSLLKSSHWDRTHTTATEKHAAASHFPFKWLISQRAVYCSDTMMKKSVRRWLGVTKIVLVVITTKVRHW